MQEIKVMSSIYPQKQLSYNEWMSMFKVSSRVKEKYRACDRAANISRQYDFSKLNNNKFSKLLEEFKIM